MDDHTNPPPRARGSPNAVTLLPTIRSFRAPETGRARPAYAGRLVAGYEVLAELGRGGTGVVYKARQVQLDRLVALKMILSSRASREELLRFRTEAEAIARLAHPNIVTIYEVGEHDDQPFLSLELCDEGLDRCLGGRPQPADIVAPLVEAVARAVHFAHERGIVHRDLKPANVLLVAAEGAPPGALLATAVPKVADFGLAKCVGRPTSQTRAGEVLGTPAYMAPEQAEGRNEEVGPRTDVYALGAILYECLTGRPPFLANSLALVLEQVRRHDPAAPRRLVPDVPRDLEIITLKCLSKDPSRRYASAADLADDLRRWRGREPIRARPAGPVERALKWARRHPTAAGLAGLSLLLSAALALGVQWHILQLRASVAEAREAMRAAGEHNRRAELIAECERRLAAGCDAMIRGAAADARAAAFAFATIRERIGPDDARADPALGRLRRQAETLGKLADVQLARLADAAVARKQARRFYALRDEAFVHVNLDLLAGPGMASPEASRAAARHALYVYPDAASLPEDERARLRQARQEVLGLLREPGARADGDSLFPGQCRLLKGDPRGALKYLDEALARDADLLWARLLKALAHLQLGELADATAALDTCAARQPDFVWTYLLRGRAHTGAKRYDRAEADLDRAAPLAGDRAARYVLYLNRGALAAARGRPASAVRELEQAVRVWPNRPHAYAELAQAHRAAGRLDRAAFALDRAVRLAPREPSLWRTRARLCAERGDCAAALRDLDAALAHPAPAPVTGADRAERARLLYLAGRYREALTDSEQALRLCPGSPVALRLRAEALLELGRPGEALAAFDRFFKVGKPDVDAHRRRARARAGTGDLTGVVGDYTAALALRRDAPLLTARGYAYLIAGAPRAARDDFEAALTLDADHHEARLGRAQARLELKEVPEALADVEAVLRQRPRSSRLLYQAAATLARASARVPARQAGALRQQAVGRLQEAVLALPSSERAAFWRKQVAGEPAFRALAGQAAYARLDKQYRPTPGANP